jgi:hypothetical protein
LAWYEVQFDCVLDEEKVKTTDHRRRGTLFVSCGFFLALLLSDFPHVYAEDQGANWPIVETKEGKNLKRNDKTKEPDNRRQPIGLVGPSGEEIHDFLYPTAQRCEVVTQAN